MAFDVEGARKAGYSEAEIVDFLGSENKIDVKAARGAGYSDAELLAELSKPVAAAPKPAPKATPAAPQKGLWDRVKDTASEGVDNLVEEAKNPFKAVRKAQYGVYRGAMDLIDGGAQLAARAASGAATKYAPGTAVDKFLRKELTKVETVNQEREDEYQKATKGSVLAGVGRIGGNIIMPAGSIANTARGASLVAKAGAASRAGAVTAALMPVHDMAGKDGTEYATEKLKQMAVGATIGAAAPVAGKVALEAASKLGSKAAERSLVKTRSAQMFDKSKNAKADAEVITELGGVGERIGDRNLVTLDINARSKKVTAEAVEALKQAGGTPEEILALKNWQGLTVAEREALKGTENGAHIASIVEKMDRYRDLTPGELSSRMMAPLRAALDIAPLPNVVRQVGRRVLGGTQSRYETAEKFLDPRSQRAAREYLEQHGPSDGTVALQRLKDRGADLNRKVDGENVTEMRLEAQNKAMTEDPSMLVPSLADPVERADKLARLKKAMQERDRELNKTSKMKARQNAGQLDLVVPSIRNATEAKAATAKTKADMAVSSKTLAEEAKAAQEAKEAVALQAMKIKARKISGTPGGGGYQALAEHVGIDKKDLATVLRVGERVPELADEIRKIRVEGKNTSDGAIYPITDALKGIADGLGMKSRGVLTQATDKAPAVVRKTAADRRRELAYQAGVDTRQGIYKEIANASKEINDPAAREAVRELVSELKSTPRIQSDRNRMIDELEAKHPEAKDLFRDVRKFK